MALGIMLNTFNTTHLLSYLWDVIINTRTTIALSKEETGDLRMFKFPLPLLVCITVFYLIIFTVVLYTVLFSAQTRPNVLMLLKTQASDQMDR